MRERKSREKIQIKRREVHRKLKQTKKMKRKRVSE